MAKQRRPRKKKLALGIKLNPRDDLYPFQVVRGAEVIGNTSTLSNAHGLLLWVSFMDLLTTEIDFRLARKRRLS